MDDEFDAVCEAVLERVEPDPAEREALADVADQVVERAQGAVADLPVDARVELVGSTARDTWIAGDRDVDVFVCFDPDLDRESLEAYGLRVGHAVLPEGHEEYAEHPYVVGTVDGFEVDLVPCYDVADATAIQSAVDRTPFHTRYVADRLTADLTAAVRLAKAFCKAIGVYGSDLRTRGFSGFLLELLVLEYGDFRGLCEAASDWHPPVTLDPAAHGTETFEDPLVVVDPTDPARNVAAVLTADNVARLQHYARDLLADPRPEAFESPEVDPLAPTDVRAAIRARETHPVALRFATPDIVDDQLWPQLERSLDGIAGELDRRGFDVMRAEALANDDVAVLFVDLAVAERPAVARHEGPPVHVRDHAADFYAAYADTNAYGPFIEAGRYVVERERAFATASALLESDAVFDVALGTHVASALEADYDVLAGEAVASLAERFGTELAAFFEPRP
jgi:tRNA nucleotidyltransferase (CCA-adding enzyme)